MKKISFLLVSILISIRVIGGCPCEEPDSFSLPLNDVNGDAAVSICSAMPIANNEYYPAESFKIMDCRKGVNLLEYSGDDILKVENLDDGIIIYRFKTLPANETLEHIKIPITAYKIIPNRKGSLDVILIRMMAIPTMPDSFWDDLTKSCELAMDSGEITKDVMAKTLYAALYGNRHARGLFLNLPARISDESLRSYYDELVETYNIYNDISRRGKKIFKGKLFPRPDNS